MSSIAFLLHGSVASPCTTSKPTENIQSDNNHDIQLEPVKNSEFSLAKADIEKVIKGKLPRINDCYEKLLKTKPKVTGKIETQFIIDSNGAVTDAKILQSTLADPTTELCVSQEIKTWQFPRPTNGGKVTVKYPFVFTLK